MRRVDKYNYSVKDYLQIRILDLYHKNITGVMSTMMSGESKKLKKSGKAMKFTIIIPLLELNKVISTKNVNNPETGARITLVLQTTDTTTGTTQEASNKSSKSNHDETSMKKLILTTSSHNTEKLFLLMLKMFVIIKLYTYPFEHIV